MRSPLTDEEQPDGQLANDAIARLKGFSQSNIGVQEEDQPFFLAVGFHKPVSPIEV